MRPHFDQRFDLGFGERVAGLLERAEDGAPHKIPIGLAWTAEDA
ncbi:MAG: hypothetical protein O3A25_19525 [Acidobacteria bacterium]|nr:hypothetical protein [Acidobacteriota bacterium]